VVFAVPRLSDADSPLDVPAAESRQHPRAGLRGGRTTTTRLTWWVLNRMDRFNWRWMWSGRVPRLKTLADRATQRFTEMMQRHKLYVSEYGEDMPEVAN